MNTYTHEYIHRYVHTDAWMHTHTYKVNTNLYTQTPLAVIPFPRERGRKMTIYLLWALGLRQHSLPVPEKEKERVKKKKSFQSTTSSTPSVSFSLTLLCFLCGRSWVDSKCHSSVTHVDDFDPVRPRPYLSSDALSLQSKNLFLKNTKKKPHFFFLSVKFLKKDSVEKKPDWRATYTWNTTIIWIQ